MQDVNVFWLLITMVSLPFLGFLAQLVFQFKTPSNVGLWHIGLQFFALMCALWVYTHPEGTHFIYQFSWLKVSPQIDILFSLRTDALSNAMCVMVNFISLMVQIYSFTYKKGDAQNGRYFGYLGLFTGSMLALVLSGNLFFLFFFWELVGFSSYLLIGYWFDKEKAVQANKKAFIVNKIADVLLLSGIVLLLVQHHSVEFEVLKNIPFEDLQQPSYTLIGFLLFLGACGKSAQFPFQVWLPDAMEGPTPVSALIHAATMVAAGVYLMARVHFLLNMDVLPVVSLVGAITAMLGAFFALSQKDLKKVLAFSTISQLGFMMAGIGTGVWQTGVFHLFTHAFFKAGLFLSAGTIIHTMAHVHHAKELELPGFHFDKQDMHNMGGLKQYMPITFWVYTVCAAALVGLPFFSGFLSKDSIYMVVYQAMQKNEGYGYAWVFAMLLVTSMCTALYVTKQWLLVFFGRPRLMERFEINWLEKHFHESSIGMWFPTALLAFCSLGILFSLQFWNNDSVFLLQMFELTNLPHTTWIPFLTVLVSMAGMFLGWYFYRSKAPVQSRFYKIKHSRGAWFVFKQSYAQLYMNSMYQKTIVQPTLAISEFTLYFDRKIYDRFLDKIGVAHIVLAHLLLFVDRYIIDGLVHLPGYLLGRLEQYLKQFNQGTVQQWLIQLFMLAAGMWLFFAWW